MIFGISNVSFRLVVIFTLIETGILALWLDLALKHKLIESIVVLFVGLLVEHVIATIAGKKA